MLLPPPVRFHARYRNVEPAVGRRQHGRVEDPVPLAADELLSFHHEDRLVRGVPRQQLRRRRLIEILDDEALAGDLRQFVASEIDREERHAEPGDRMADGRGFEWCDGHGHSLLLVFQRGSTRA